MNWVEKSETSPGNESVIQDRKAEGASGASSCWINGRQFVQHGTLWIDQSVAKMPRARRVRIRFDSREYFQLLNRFPKLIPHLSGARNLHLAVGDTIYEIHE